MSRLPKETPMRRKVNAKEAVAHPVPFELPVAQKGDGSSMRWKREEVKGQASLVLVVLLVILVIPG
jgi:hypothetical protein